MRLVPTPLTMLLYSISHLPTLFFFFFSSRRRHTRSVSAFLLNRSSDLGKSYCSRRFGGATCDDKSAQIYARFDKNDWRIQPAEFYRFHDAEVNTFGYF